MIYLANSATASEGNTFYGFVADTKLRALSRLNRALLCGSVDSKNNEIEEMVQVAKAFVTQEVERMQQQYNVVLKKSQEQATYISILEDMLFEMLPTSLP